MTPNIPADIYERADILCDQFRHIEDDREFVARILMAADAPSKRRKRPQPRPAGMTERQSNVYAFIRCFSAEQGYCPSYQQIADAIGVSSKGRVSEIVSALEERGLLQRLPGRPRSLSINTKARA